jgi:hypothetical protein
MFLSIKETPAFVAAEHTSICKTCRAKKEARRKTKVQTLT